MAQRPSLQRKKKKKRGGRPGGGEGRENIGGDGAIPSDCLRQKGERIHFGRVYREGEVRVREREKRNSVMYVFGGKREKKEESNEKKEKPWEKERKTLHLAKVRRKGKKKESLLRRGGRYQRGGRGKVCQYKKKGGGKEKKNPFWRGS